MTKIYFLVDDQNRVIPVCDWDASIEADPEWIVGVIEGNAYESHGIPLYKYVNQSIMERTAGEIQADINALPPVEPTDGEILRADVDFLLMMMEE